jgi:hypothetical protein
VAMALMVVVGFFFSEQLGDLRPILWLETAATTAFGVAWLTKGEWILPDSGAVGGTLRAIGQSGS